MDQAKEHPDPTEVPDSFPTRTEPYPHHENDSNGAWTGPVNPSPQRLGHEPHPIPEEDWINKEHGNASFHPVNTGVPVEVM